MTLCYISATYNTVSYVNKINMTRRTILQKTNIILKSMNKVKLMSYRDTQKIHAKFENFLSKFVFTWDINPYFD